jgi:hypothetical protein
MMYKIQNKLVPTYLRNACPPLTRERTTYNLRTGMDITTRTSAPHRNLPKILFSSNNQGLEQCRPKHKTISLNRPI